MIKIKSGFYYLLGSIAFLTLVFSAFLLIYPAAYTPLNQYLTSALPATQTETVSPVNLNQNEVPAFATAFSQTLKSVQSDLAQSKQDIAKNIRETSAILTNNISKSTTDVQNSLANDISDKLDASGGIVDGKLTIDKNLTVGGTTYVNDILPDADGKYNLGSSIKSWNIIYANRITSLIDPQGSTDAANKQYVDNQLGAAAFIKRTGTTLSAVNAGDSWDLTSGPITGGNLNLSGALVVGGTISGLNLSGTNTGDNATNTLYASDYRSTNFAAGTNYLAPNGSAAALTNFPTFNQSTTGNAGSVTNGIYSTGTYADPSWITSLSASKLSGTVGVSQGGTGTTTQFTLGSITFAGASGIYSQDNANLFWDNTNKRLGIGTASPGVSLAVVGNGYFSGNLQVSGITQGVLQDNGGQVFNVKAYGATGNGSTDDSAAILAAITAANAANGGTIYFPAGTYRVDNQIAFPNNGAIPPRQKSFRLTGAGASHNGQGGAPSGGAQLDLRYAGTVAKIDTRGLGYLEIDHLTLKDTMSDSLPFIQTTNTTLHIHDAEIYGNKSGTSADQDAIVLGGTNTGSSDGTANSPFQGYGTIIEGNYFNNIRRMAYLRTYANGIQIVNNTVWVGSGSNLVGGAAIELTGVASNSDVGNYIAGNLIEMSNYPYGVVAAYANNNSFIANNFYDATVTTLAFYRFTATATYNSVVDGYRPDNYALVSDVSGSNTVETSHQSQMSILSQPWTFTAVPTIDASGIGPIIKNANGDESYTQMFQSNGNQIAVQYVPHGGSPESVGGWVAVSPTDMRLQLYGTANSRLEAASSQLQVFSQSGQALWLGDPSNNMYVLNGTIFSTRASGTPSLKMTNTGSLQWSGTSSAGAGSDLGLTRNAAGILEVNNGTQGTYQDLVVRNLTTTGDVGIGTSSPGQKLSVEGTFGILETGSSPNYHTIFQGGDQVANVTYTLPTAQAGGSNYVLSNNGSGVLSWQAVSGVSGVSGTGATNQIAYWIDSSTLSGVTAASSSFLTTNGSSVPSLTAISSDTFTQYALITGRSGGQTLIGGTAANNILIFQGNNTTGNTVTNANLQFKVGDSGATTAMTILNNGSVGIGTPTPTAGLQVTRGYVDALNTNLRMTGNIPGLSFENTQGTSRNFAILSQYGGATQLNFNYSSVFGGNPTNVAMTIDGATGNMLFSGKVGIGTTSPDTALKVIGALCVKSTDVACAGNTAGSIYATNTVVQGADYAEYFSTTDKNLQPGEAVCVDTQKDNSVKRCQNSGDNNVMGVVSKNPSIIGNSDNNRDQDPNYKVIAMLGQIQANINSENGSIQIGDSLTSASAPGYLRKADAGESTVGVAMQKFDGTQGQIQVLISRRNKSLTVEKVEEAVTQRIADMNVQDQVNKIVADATEIETQLIASLRTGMDSYELRMKAQEDLAKELQTQIDALKVQTQNIASLPVALAKIDLNTQDITYLNLVLGLNDKNPNDINIAGVLTAKEIKTQNIEIENADKDAMVIGTAAIVAGEKEIKVETNAVKADSKILVSPVTATPVIWSISEKKENTSFTLKIAEPLTEDIKFDWWIIKEK